MADRTRQLVHDGTVSRWDLEVLCRGMGMAPSMDDTDSDLRAWLLDKG